MFGVHTFGGPYFAQGPAELVAVHEGLRFTHVLVASVAHFRDAQVLSVAHFAEVKVDPVCVFVRVKAGRP